MIDAEPSPEVDDLDAGLMAALRARREAPPADPEGAAVGSLSESLKAKLTNPQRPKKLRPRQIHARIRRMVRRHKERLSQPPRFRAPPPSPKYHGPPVRCGFDAEWVTLPDGNDGYRNEVLCTTAVIECGGRRSRYYHTPRGPLREDRPTMAEFVQNAIRQAMKDGTVSSMPDSVTFFGHFIRGDLASFSDFWDHKREFRGIGKTLASGRAGHAIEMADASSGTRHSERRQPGGVDAPGADIEQPRTDRIALRALDGHRFLVRVRFVDTIKLTPGQRGLAYAAMMVGRRKLDLHEDLGVPVGEAEERPECAGMGLVARYGKDRMDLVLRDFPDQMRKYAFEDAEIALDYGLMIERIAVEQFGLRGLPSTLAGCAAAIMRNMSGGAAPLAALVGRTSTNATYFDERKRTYRTVKRDVPSPGLDIFSTLAAACYHGGRNECFYHGPTDDRMWYDYDLPGAYTTALVPLRPIDHDGVVQEFDPDAYGIDDMGLAWITFKFPPGTPRPCLPVEGALGVLFFPLEGTKEDRVFVGSPEIFLARCMGAQVAIIQGFKAPWKSDTGIFEPFTRLVQTKRREFPKATHPALNELWKEVGNSAYGLTAQGLKDKRTFDPASMGSKPIGPSPLTEPFMAAWVTSFIRAVLGEILAGVPAWGTVVTATTDGLLTDVPLDQLKLDGPLCSYFAGIRERLFGEREVLDPKPKHGARQLISVAVRTTFTALEAEGVELVCAKGSVKPPTSADPVAQNAHMVQLYMDQFPGMKVEHEQLISAREQLTRELDLYGVKRERTLNLRYDFKRRPVRPRMVSLPCGTERIAWGTVPWPTATEAEFARAHVDGWSRDRARLLKTMDDYRDWEAYSEASWAVKQVCEAADVRTVQVRHDNAWGILKRVFLQAGRQRRWGITFERRGLTSIAKILTDAGFQTGKEDITYAGRRNAPLLEHCVPWVPETVDLLRVILLHFPNFEYWNAFRTVGTPTGFLTGPASP
jgi:hypothetical protein